MTQSDQSARLSCPNCGFDVTDLLEAHPGGYMVACAVAVESGLVCCGHRPTNEELKAWARVRYAAAAPFHGSWDG